MLSSCSGNPKGNCACPAPIQNKRKSSFYFIMITLAILLIIAFNLVDGLEEDALSSQNLSMIFILGFLTGLHCIGMCGGFMMSYMRFGKKHGLSEFKMHAQYAVTKVFSYAFFGALFGLLGTIVHFSSNLKSLVSFAGGFFLLYLGAKGLGLFKKLGKLPLMKYLQFLRIDTQRLASPWSIV